MARKKKSNPVVADSNGVSPATASDPTTTSSSVSSTSKPPIKKPNKSPDAPTPSLTISRNKHWRYISAFHGPWLQLPHEILETLAHSNYLSPRPRQTDPGVLYDLLKIRKLVDEASDLAVRAQNGTASSALAKSDNGLPGGALGLSYRGVGGNAKLSPERKYRMRELATQKLAQAYRLDEVAASVATMQSASTLDSVASLVLQRSPGNADARYVHFFHEKIPSRMMSECTPLAPLNDIIAAAPGHAAPFRTRALTRIFKDDHTGAIQDLTEALALCKLDQAKHRSTRNQLIPIKVAREEAEKRKIWTRDWMQENRVMDDDQPKGIEMQLLFQRGNQYLTVACQHIRIALENFRVASVAQSKSNDSSSGPLDSSPPSPATPVPSAYQKGLEARELVRKNAKRALRDYTQFFSQLDYAHAPMHQANGGVFSRDTLSDQLDDSDSSHRASPANGRVPRPGQSSALVQRTRSHQGDDQSPNQRTNGWSSPPPEPIVHDISTILSTSPPADLPLYPSPKSSAVATRSSNPEQYPPQPQHDEMITYHPLMHETLHSLLLTHCLLQTPPTALLRHANNVARLARLADGYPFFLSARSPARADWAEILRKTKNWINLSGTWEVLCKPPPTSPDETRQSPSQEKTARTIQVNNHIQKSENAASRTNNKNGAESETSDQKRDRIHKDAVMDALGDERVVDDDTFQRAVQAREQRAWRDEDGEKTSAPSVVAASGIVGNDTSASTNATPHSPAEPFGRGRGFPVAKDEEYLIGTERAESITKWILEAPVVVETSKPKKGKKKPGKKMAYIQAVPGQLENGAVDLDG